MRKSKSIYISIILAIFFIVLLLSNSGALTARAAVYAGYYTSVLDDLYKDESFDESQYPESIEDTDFKVIQIAESEDGELFVYLYQPLGEVDDYLASSINIARAKDNSPNLSFINYELQYLNSSGVFYKYKVNGFTVSTAATRYYNISSVFRPYGEKLGNGNRVDEIAYAVSQIWTVTTVNGEPSYSMTYTETIPITNKYVGFVAYYNGVDLGWTVAAGATCAHFVAFSTDRPMDKLLSASLTFKERSVSCSICCSVFHTNHKLYDMFDYEYGETVTHEPNPLILRYTDVANNDGGGIGGEIYQWDRIQTTAEFLKDKEDSGIIMTNGALSGLKKTQWVLNFYETPFIVNEDIFTGLFVGDAEVNYTEVSEVTILQLEFKYNGQTYKLGVVDNKQTGGYDGGNLPTPTWVTDGLPGWAIALIVVVLVVLVIVVLCVIFPAVAPFIGKLLSALWWLITLPFRGIAWVINKLFDIREDKSSNEEGNAKGQRRQGEARQQKTARNGGR